MKTITVVFTKRERNPVSWLIRWALPRSRFYNATASHCLIQDGEYVIEASLTHGVRRVLAVEAMKGATITEVVQYEVPDAEAGLKFARSQVGKKYDFKGAFGLALRPDREYTEDDSWFCFELAAATLKAAGRDSFRADSHITGTMLYAIKP
jgi:hypothetical protein